MRARSLLHRTVKLVDTERYQEIVWNPHLLDASDPVPESIQGPLLDLGDVVGSAMARNHHLTPEKAQQALGDSSLVIASASNAKLPETMQSRLIDMDDPMVLDTLAQNPGLSIDHQYRIYHQGGPQARALAQNPGLVLDLQQGYVEALDIEDLRYLSRNDNLDPNLREVLYESILKDSGLVGSRAGRAVVRNVLQRGLLPDTLPRKVLRDQDHGDYFKMALAINPHLDEETLEGLAGEQETRAFALTNPSLPLPVQHEAMGGDPAAHKYLAMNTSLTYHNQLALLERYDGDLALLQHLAVHTAHRNIQDRLTVYEDLSTELLYNPETHLGALQVILPHLLIEDYEHYCFHPQQRLSAHSFVQPLRYAAPWLLAHYAQEIGVAITDLVDLSSNWQGSLQDLGEAVRLTRR